MPIVIPQQLRGILAWHAEQIAARLGPLDTGAPFTPLQERLVFLCFTNRCGSNYLAQLLAATGRFNEAGEFFNAETVLQHAAARNLRSFHEYVRWLPTVVAARGFLVAKAGIDQLIMLADASVLEAGLSTSTFILLERKDKLGQAISRVIAAQNGRWTTEHRSDVPDAALRYDGAWIAQEIEKIERANFAFYRFFSANGIAPVHLSYEAVIADPQTAVNQITDWLAIERVTFDPARIRLRQQSGGVNDEWRTRFMREQGVAPGFSGASLYS